MVPLTDLLLPIVVASLVVWIASALMWMVLPHHRSDWRKLPDEDTAAAALRGVAPGQYHIPHADRATMKTEAWKEKARRGPMAMIVVVPPGMPSMGRNLGLYFVYCLIVSVFVAYLLAHTRGPGSDPMEVCRVAGTAAILGYAGALPPLAIWFGRRWPSILKEVLDGIVYGLLTGAVFAWLWPA